MKLTLDKIAEYTHGTIRGDKNAAEITLCTASIDSRRVGEDCLFIALKGENTDGHLYVDKALEAGAGAALVVKGKYEGNGNAVETEDTARAMGDIAAGILRDRTKPLFKIAVTGSVGKTTTKDMAAFVIARHMKTLKSEMNFNNEYGLPLTVMRLEEDHEALITEMGMRGIGQIEYLTNIVCPNAAVITNIGVSHLENLGTRENILRAKLEVCKGLSQNMQKGISKRPALILNGDNDMLSNETLVRSILKEYGADDIDILYFGTEENSSVRAENIHGSSYELITPEGRFKINLNVPGVHNVYNSMAAVCLAMQAGIAAEDAVKDIELFGDEVSRQKLIPVIWGTVIDDAYNASPDSMNASLSVLQGLDVDIRIAALGDMLELGSMSDASHRKVGALASDIADVLLAVGPLSHLYCEAFKGRKIQARDSAEGARLLLPIIHEYENKGLRVGVLVKGSNAMRMGAVSDALISNLT